MVHPTDQKKIRAIALQLHQVIDNANSRLQALKELCSHPNVTKTPKANTGNWCPDDDRYWYDCKCPDCGKFWMEDQ